MGVIAIEGIEVFAYHGVYEVEREKGNSYVVDVYMETDTLEAAQTDQLIDTIDYFEVYKLVLASMEDPVHLIERLVGKIGQQILIAFPPVRQVSVKVRKIRPLAMERCEQTYVEMKFDRSHLPLI